MKDYVTKALISTVDHLGSVAFKVNSFVDEKVDEVSATKLRVSCIEKVLLIAYFSLGCVWLETQRRQNRIG